MRYPVIVVPFLNVTGMALFPFILVKTRADAANEIIIRHETIHLQQELELLVIPFYLLYITHYLINLYRFRDHHQAYMNIVFEREAYHNERDPTYLQTRKLWAWTRYFG